MPNYNLGCQATSASRLAVASAEFDSKSKKIKVTMNSKYTVPQLKRAFTVVLMDTEATSSSGKSRTQIPG